MPRPVNNYIFVVDGHRRPSRQRSTAGRYRVGARDAKEAEKALRKHLNHVGSPCLLCEDPDGAALKCFPNSHFAQLGEVVKEFPTSES